MSVRLKAKVCRESLFLYKQQTISPEDFARARTSRCAPCAFPVCGSAPSEAPYSGPSSFTASGASV